MIEIAPYAVGGGLFPLATPTAPELCVGDNSACSREPLADVRNRKMPGCNVSGFTGPEKQTISRGFSLKPSNLFSIS